MRAIHFQAAIAGSLLALLALTYSLYLPALSGPFMFDDLSNISLLAQINGQIDRQSLGRYLFSFSGDLGRPLSALSFLIEDWDWPTDPAPFKRNNLLLHLLNGLLLFVLVRRLLLNDRPASVKNELIALGTTAMWLVQPMQVASVMLTVQRMNLLSACFILIGLVLHVVSLQSEKQMTSLRALTIMTRLGFFTALAFLCKENGALLPLFAACLHATVLRTNLAHVAAGPRRWIVWGTLAPWLSIAAYALINPGFILGGYTSRDFTLPERLLTESRILWDYLGQIFVPRISGHSVFHDDYQISTTLLDPITLLSFAGWLVAIAAAIGLRRRAPWVAFCIAWFLVGHLMESSFIGLELYFEHRNYLAMLGPLLLLVMLVAKTRKSVAITIFAIWMGFALISSWSNAQVWGSSARMAAIWHAEHPTSVRAMQLKASELAKNGKVDSAISLLDDGYSRMPMRAELLFQTIPLRCGTRTMERSYVSGILVAAADARTPQIASNQLVKLRHVAANCAEKFTLADWWEITDVLLSNPRLASSANAISHIRYQRGQAAVVARDLDQAMTELDLAYAAEPNPFIPREQATYLLSAGLLDDAERYLEKSDSTPIGRWKRFLLNPRRMNGSLRQAINMRRSQQMSPASL